MAVLNFKTLKIYYKFFFLEKEFCESFLGSFDFLIEILNSLPDKKDKLDVNGNIRNNQYDIVYELRYRVFSMVFKKQFWFTELCIDEQDFLEFLVALKASRVDFNDFNLELLKHLSVSKNFELLSRIFMEDSSIKEEYIHILKLLNLSFDPINISGEYDYSGLILYEKFDLMLKKDSDHKDWVKVLIDPNDIEMFLYYCKDLKLLQETKKLFVQDLLINLFIVSMYDGMYINYMYTRTGRYSLNNLNYYIISKIYESSKQGERLIVNLDTVNLDFFWLKEMLDFFLIKLDKYNYVPISIDFNKKPLKKLRKVKESVDFVSELGLFDSETSDGEFEYVSNLKPSDFSDRLDFEIANVFSQIKKTKKKNKKGDE